MNRRGFLGAMLAAAAAPAIVKAESLMPIWVPKQELIVPKQELAANQWYFIEARKIDGVMVPFINGQRADLTPHLVVTEQDGFINVQTAVRGTFVSDLRIAHATKVNDQNCSLTFWANINE